MHFELTIWGFDQTGGGILRFSQNLEQVFEQGHRFLDSNRAVQSFMEFHKH